MQDRRRDPKEAVDERGRVIEPRMRKVSILVKGIQFLYHVNVIVYPKDIGVVKEVEEQTE